jgi:hypothetical protein
MRMTKELQKYAASLRESMERNRAKLEYLREKSLRDYYEGMADGYRIAYEDLMRRTEEDKQDDC